MTAPPDFASAEVAIIGMAGHFPGAADVDELWERVLDGDDCLLDVSVEEAISRGVPASEATAPEYVRRAGVLDRVEYFDPAFFGIGPRDASIMDPQHRHFLEVTWEALESAGIVPEQFDGAIGVFGGCGANTYMLNNLLPNRELLRRMGWFLLRHTANDKDFLTTSVSYRLDLRGPSVNVQTACSTSLVAVHLAVQSLLSMECDVAVAGGATIEVPHGVGYHYQEGEILSPDGRCRAFDAASGGTVLTSGAAAVTLRRLDDAIADGDPVLAVIKGSAVNNDGARKVSYLAPSVDGHADVVREALAVAGLGGGDIQFLEAHGTGTAVGDPIEVAALTEAFRTSTDAIGFCRLGSTKPNIGHLDTAAGVASLIKVVQALRHATLPPIANHTAPSPLLSLDRSPFTLSGTASPWPGDAARRAGVSSLGVGGTNAHVIVEEAPHVDRLDGSPPEQVLVLSGRDAQAVEEAAERLAAHIEADPSIDLGDVAATLATRRRHHPVRRVVTATDAATAPSLLRTRDRARTFQSEAHEHPPRVAFLFPGGGSQYSGMARHLDRRFSAFHEIVSEGAARVRDLGGADIFAHLTGELPAEGLNAPTVSLPSVFLVSLGMAKQWMAWGVEPDLLIGHSLGEYLAAHLAGVIGFDDVLRLVVTRAELMERVGGDGAMLVVPVGEAEARRLLTDGTSLAVINANDESVLAGKASEIEDIAKVLADQGTPGTLIPLSTAAHSLMLDPVLDEFRAVVKSVRLSAPTKPYLSNLDGAFITAERATDPDYWVDHLRHTVRFADDLRVALDGPPTVTVEMGPGQSLSSYARRAATPPTATIASLRHSRLEVDDSAFALQAFGQLWATGADVDVSKVIGSQRRGVRLPTYPFQRQRYWIDPPEHSTIAPSSTSPAGSATSDLPTAGSAPALQRLGSPSDMWWRPTVHPIEEHPSPGNWPRWFVVGPSDDSAVRGITTELRERGLTVAQVEPSAAVERLAGDLTDGDAVVVLRGSGACDFARATELWLGTAVNVVRALDGATNGHRLALVTERALSTPGQPATSPVDSLALGVVAVAPREYPDLDTLLLDVDDMRDVRTVVEELTTRSGHRTVVVRGDDRLTPVVERHALVPPPRGDASSIMAGGTYVVTGGLGGIGHTLAMHVARRGGNVVVVTSSQLPEQADREAWLASHGPGEPTSERIRRLQALEAAAADNSGSVGVYVADLGRAGAVTAMLDDVQRTYARIDGVIHAAGALRDRLIATVQPDDLDTVIAPKARAALEISDELRRRGASWLLLISSTSTHLAPPGQVAYVAANAVLDSLAGERDGLRVVTLNSGVWSEAGMARRAAQRERLTITGGRPIADSVFEELIQVAPDTTDLVGHLDARHHWFLDEHRDRSGQAILPGTAHLELLLRAGTIAGASVPDGRPCLRGVSVHEPLAVDPDAPKLIRVRVTSTGDGRARLQLDTDGGPNDGWVTHTTAELCEADLPSFSVPEPTTNVAIDPMAGQRDHLQLGGHWTAKATGTVSGDVAVALVNAIPELGLTAHPAVVDLATGLAAQLVRHALGTTSLLVPIGYDAVSVLSPVPHRVRVSASLRSAEPGRAASVDVDIADEFGRGAMRIEGLRLWAVAEIHTDVEPAPTTHSAASASTTSSVSSSRPPSLAALAERLGIRPDEGVTLVEQLLASDLPRLVASSVELERLAAAAGTASDAASPTAAAARAEPVAGLTTLDRVAAIWCDLLDLDSVQPDDDFFDLGGHSLIAIRMLSRIQREIGVRLQLTDIFDASTLGALTALVAADLPPEADAVDDVHVVDGTSTDPLISPAGRTFRSLVQISTGGAGRPLFIVHGAGGNVLFLWNMARALSGDRPVYGFQAIGVQSDDMPDPSIEAMASRYVAELRASHDGPYLLGGYSGGGLVTLEMVRQLEQLGERVQHVLLFDSVPQGHYPGRLTRWRNFVDNWRRVGLDPLRPYIREQVATWKRRINRDSVRDELRLAQQRALGQVEVDGYVNLYFFFTATADRYQLDRYRSDVTVFKADLIWPVQPHDYYWSDYIDGSLDVVSVPGDHHSMFHAQLVPRLAAAVRTRLQQIDPVDERPR